MMLLFVGADSSEQTQKLFGAHQAGSKSKKNAHWFLF
jgi:hypothetical protein